MSRIKIADNKYQNMVEVRSRETGKLLGFLELHPIMYNGNRVEIALNSNIGGWHHDDPPITIEIVSLYVIGLEWNHEGKMIPVPQLSCLADDWEKLLENYKDDQ